MSAKMGKGQKGRSWRIAIPSQNCIGDGLHEEDFCIRRDWISRLFYS